MSDILRASVASREVSIKNGNSRGKFSTSSNNISTLSDVVLAPSSPKGSNNNSLVPFNLLVICVIGLAIFFRVFDYFDRILIHSDHSLFAQAAIYSARTFSIPQIGPFAQSTFFTGPWWLWILSIFYLFPFGVLTPWFLMTLVSLGFVGGVFWLGRQIGDKWLGLAAAFLAAVSPAVVDNSLALWNAAADPLLALLAIYFLIKFYKTKNPFFVFALSFTVSMATTIHFQAGLLAPLVLVALITSRPKLIYFLLGFVGLVIPLLPFLIFDLRFNWFWIKSVWIYLTVDQYRFWVPNRWLIYAFDYWPQTWGYILGVSKWFGFLIIGLLSILTVLRLKVVRDHKIFYLLALSFLLEAVLFRYYIGQRFFYFSNFAHPAVFLLTAWVIVELYKIKKPLGIILALLVFSFSFNSAFVNLAARDITYRQVNSLKNQLYELFGGKTYDIYGCSLNGALISHPLALLIYDDGRNQQDGEKIGVCFVDKKINWHVLTEEEIADKNTWLNHSTEQTYRSMTEWWKANPPK